MKRYFMFVVIVGLMFSFSLAKAEDSNTLKDRREAFREEMKASREAFLSGLKKDREAFLAELKTKKEEWRTIRLEKKLEFCDRVKEIITKRFATVLAQMERFQTKAGEIIAKLEVDGKNTTLAQEALDLSKSKLADAKAKLLDIKGLVPDDCKDMTPETFAQIKLGARVATDLLKESREDLHQAIQEIKNLRVEEAQDNGND